MKINYNGVKTVSHRLSYEIKHAAKNWLFTHNFSNNLDPAEIMLILTNRCNMRCKMCDFPQRPLLNDELTTEQWIKNIQDIKQLFPKSSITLTGGQCTLRKDLIPIIAATKDFRWKAILTNGSFMTDAIADELCNCHYNSYGTSLDGCKKTHNLIRGNAKSYDYCLDGIKKMQAALKRHNYFMRINITTVVTKLNFRELPNLVQQVRDMGDNVFFRFQQLQHIRISPAAYKELWIGPEDIPELEKIVNSLRKMKEDGYPITSSFMQINTLKQHYIKPIDLPLCHLPYDYLFLQPNGDLRICDYKDPVGHIDDNTSLADIWHSERTQLLRRQQAYCDKQCHDQMRCRFTLTENFDKQVLKCQLKRCIQ